MAMKITDTIISIPPYISTSWDQVASIHMEKGDLIFTLKDGKTVYVPNLNREVIEQIFSAHTAFLEAHPTPPPKKEAQGKIPGEFIQNFPFRFNVGSLDGVGSALQHNPAYSGLPSIPDEIAEKIAALAKVISEEELQAMPPAEINCNCLYCQIYRIMQKSAGGLKDHIPDHPGIENNEEKVSEEELQFSEWDVQLVSDKMYKVSSKLDPKEEYTVFLGDPIGCTCGKNNCDHIIAVLRSNA